MVEGAAVFSMSSPACEARSGSVRTAEHRPLTGFSLTRKSSSPALRERTSENISRQENIATARRPADLSDSLRENIRAFRAPSRKTCLIRRVRIYFRAPLEPSLCKPHFRYIPISLSRHHAAPARRASKHDSDRTRTTPAAPVHPHAPAPAPSARATAPAALPLRAEKHCCPPRQRSPRRESR